MKVLIFAGRVHHFLKLSPLYRALADTGHEPFFLIADNAINLDPASEFLAHSGARYFYLYDYLTEDGVAQAHNFVDEGQESFAWLGYISPFWMLFSMQEMAEVVTSMQELIVQEKPDLVIGLHENNFWVKAIAYVCAQNDIPHWVFQEGLLRKQDQELFNKQGSACEYSSRIFVWGDDAGRQYEEAGIPKDKIVVSGPIHLDEPYIFRRKSQEEIIGYKTAFLSQYGYDPARPVVTVSPPLMHQYKGDFRKDLTVITAYLQELGVHVFVKFHPFEGENVQQAIMDGVTAKLYAETDPLGLLAVTDLLVTQHSSIGVEALALGIPIIEYNTSPEPIIQSWAEQGVADFIEDVEDVETFARRLQGESSLDVNVLNDWVQTNMLCDGKAVDRVMEYIND